MTDARTPPACAVSAAPLCARACLAGVGVAGALVGGAMASGLLPGGTAGPVGLGLAVAVVTGCTGTAFQTCMVLTAADHPLVGQRYLIGLSGHFALQVLAIALGCGGFVLAGAKFEATAAFGLAFAVAATALHIAGVVVVARALRARELGERR